MKKDYQLAAATVLEPRSLRQLVLVFLVAVGLALQAQPQFAVIGNGNTNNSTTGYPAPYGNYWWGAKHQLLVTAAELTAAGMTPANISALGFTVVSTNGTSHLNWTINVYTTTAANPIAGGFINAGLVATSTVMNYVPVSGQWNMHSITPFNWWGTENLVIETCFNNGSYTANALTAWTTTLSGATYSRWRNADAAGQCTMNATGSSTSTRPDMRFEYTPLPPCSGNPPMNSVVTPTYLLCPGESAILGLATPNNSVGLTYQWQVSATSGLGPFTVVPSGGNDPVYATPSLSSTTYYEVVITCPGQGTTTSVAGTVNIAGVTTNSVPYYEDFEAIPNADRLPNCSWVAAGLGSTFRTYLGANTNFRLPNSGTRFGSFSAPTNNNYVYTNGIWMEPGITYSAAVHYLTDASSSLNWNFSMLVGPNQTPTGLMPLASLNPAVAGSYKLLSATYQVPAAGYYFLAFLATGGGPGAFHLSIDDISVTIPCTPSSGNIPNVTATSASANGCLGQAVMLNADGAHQFIWSNGAEGQAAMAIPGQIGTNTFVVQGTSTLTGCSNTAAVLVTVYPTPLVMAGAQPPAVCQGKPVILTASGANSYVWSHTALGQQVTDTPNASTVYTVVGTSVNNCTASAVVPVTVYNLPAVTASVSREVICVGESVVLSAGGASSFIWAGSSNPNVMQGSMITIFPTTTDVYTVTGTDGNNCSASDAKLVTVDICEGLREAGVFAGMRMYPNPARNTVIIERQTPGAATYEFVDLSGRLVFSSENASEKASFDVSSLPAGMYFVKIYIAGEKETVKFIKE